MAASSVLASPTILGVFALGIAYVVGKVVYLLFFHPLAKYPGPLLARLTPLYAAYHGWKGDIHLDMWRCHEKYGDYVRYKPNSLLINTTEGLQEIYGLRNAAKYVKSRGYGPMVHRAPNTLTIRGGKDHARRRRIMAHGVSEKAQRGYEGRVMRHINQFCDAVVGYDKQQTEEGTREWTKPINVGKWSNYLSFDIMADVVFGAQYNLIGAERFRYVIDCIDLSNTRMAALIQVPRIAALKIDKYIFRDAIRARNRFIKFVLRVVKERLDKANSPTTAKPFSDSEDGVNDHDVFGNLAEARDPLTGDGFQPDEIAAESTTLIVAGSDTSSTAMASVLFYLAHNRFAYDRAAAEVRATFSSRDEIKMGAKLSSCKYLHACIDESMRISPPVGSALWREVVAPGGSIIDGQQVPTGTDVGVSIYAIHHSPKNYRDPFVFRPERWLEDDGTGDSIDQARAAYNPFSIGARGCLGKGLAQTELMLTMASILFVSDFKLSEGELRSVGCGSPTAEFGRHRLTEYQLFDHITSQKKGPFLLFSERQSANA